MDITQLKAQYKAGERNFSGAQLSGVNLVWVELTGVNFQGVDLSHANLSGANLSGSDLSGESNVTFADLSRADFRNTNLKGTRLEGANLEGIQLEGAAYDKTTKFPLGFDPIRAGAISANPEPATRIPQPVVDSLAQAKPNADLEQYAVKERPKLRETKTKPKTNPPRSFDPAVTIETAKDLFEKAISDWQKPKSTNWVSAQSTQTISPQEEFALNTSGQGKSAVVPASIKGSWNWGALMLPGLWFLTNRVWFCAWIWVLGLIPYIGNFITFGFAIALAANGNTWAWQSRQWNSVEAFKKHQRRWAIAGVIAWGLIFWINLASRK
jgi:hypothetical protein